MPPGHHLRRLGKGLGAVLCAAANRGGGRGDRSRQARGRLRPARGDLRGGAPSRRLRVPRGRGGPGRGRHLRPRRHRLGHGLGGHGTPGSRRLPHRPAEGLVRPGLRGGGHALRPGPGDPPGRRGRGPPRGLLRREPLQMARGHALLPGRRLQLLHDDAHGRAPGLPGGCAGDGGLRAGQGQGGVLPPRGRRARHPRLPGLPLRGRPRV
mmetsp:Transcript_6508/g.22251  ORF Transcript_6508/g.22251 Transcript_6508/m.22251 type:complete len:209 (+) Transcript_6508:407-1033(+)